MTREELDELERVVVDAESDTLVMLNARKLLRVIAQARRAIDLEEQIGQEMAQPPECSCGWSKCKRCFP